LLHSIFFLLISGYGIGSDVFLSGDDEHFCLKATTPSSYHDCTAVRGFCCTVAVGRDGFFDAISLFTVRWFENHCTF